MTTTTDVASRMRRLASVEPLALGMVPNARRLVTLECELGALILEAHDTGLFDDDAAIVSAVFSARHGAQETVQAAAHRTIRAKWSAWRPDVDLLVEQMRSWWAVTTFAAGKLAEQLGGYDETRQRRPIRMKVAVQRYGVGRGTLRRAMRAGDLTDLRPHGHAPNAELILDENEVADRWAKN